MDIGGRARRVVRRFVIDGSQVACRCDVQADVTPALGSVGGVVEEIVASGCVLNDNL